MTMDEEELCRRAVKRMPKRTASIGWDRKLSASTNDGISAS